MSRENETRFIVQQESWEFKCALNESIFNSKKNWNRDECRWESKELNDRASFEKKNLYVKSCEYWFICEIWLRV